MQNLASSMPSEPLNHVERLAMVESGAAHSASSPCQGCRLAAAVAQKAPGACETRHWKAFVPKIVNPFTGTVISL